MAAKHNFPEVSAKLMQRIIARALKGTSGKLEDNLFGDMNMKERWNVINQWLRYIMPSLQTTKIEGEIGVIKVEFEPISELEVAHEKQMTEEKEKVLESFNVITDEEYVEEELIYQKSVNAQY